MTPAPADARSHASARPEAAAAPGSLRVGVVTPGFPPDLGGVETVAARLTDSLVAQGNRVDVLAHRRRGAPVAEGAATDGLRVRRFADWTGLRRFEIAPGLWRHLKSHAHEYDVLHAHSFHASAALAAATMASDTPLVFSPHYHGVGHTAAARVMHVLYDRPAGRIFARAHTVLCVSQAEADLVAHDYPNCAERIRVVPNGVDIDAIRAAEPFDVDRPVVLSCGRLEEYKQVHLLVRAFATVGAADAQLVVLGRGPELPALQQLSSELGLGDRVDFRGFVSDEELRRWLRTATVTVSLSRHEAFGLAPVEALVAGSAAVVSGIPAHDEVTRGVTSHVVRVPVDVGPGEVAAGVRAALGLGRHHHPVPSALSWSEVGRQVASALTSAAGVHT